MSKIMTKPPSTAYDDFCDRAFKKGKIMTEDRIETGGSINAFLQGYSSSSERSIPKKIICHSMKNIVIRVFVDGIISNRGFIYKADPYLDLAPQILKCLSDANHCKGFETVKLDPETEYAAVIERSDFVDLDELDK